MNIDGAIRGARNPMNSWAKSDSYYDENGKFIRKESYNECLLEYIAVMDEKAGVYPLTDDLKYIIQQRGDHYGWFDADGGQYLFKDQNGEKIPGINKEISWLFPCRYIG